MLAGWVAVSAALIYLMILLFYDHIEAILLHPH
jgi:hypothetical protein